MRAGTRVRRVAAIAAMRFGCRRSLLCPNTPFREKPAGSPPGSPAATPKGPRTSHAKDSNRRFRSGTGHDRSGADRRQRARRQPEHVQLHRRRADLRRPEERAVAGRHGRRRSRRQQQPLLYSSERPGGQGGIVRATVPVTPGKTLYVYVGGAGSIATGTNNKIDPGGFNGGGASPVNAFGSAGGGATDIRTAAGDLTPGSWSRAAAAAAASGFRSGRDWRGRRPSDGGSAPRRHRRRRRGRHPGGGGSGGCPAPRARRGWHLGSGRRRRRVPFGRSAGGVAAAAATTAAAAAATWPAAAAARPTSSRPRRHHVRRGRRARAVVTITPMESVSVAPRR